MNALNPTQVNELLRRSRAGATAFLIGAGGCGMSGLGHLLLDLGFVVAGSDLVVNEEIRQLRARGAQIHDGHAAEHIDKAQPFLVIYTSAVRRDNVELQAAERRQIPIVRRAVLLAALLQRRCGVGVAGMHGKTTTASLLAFALQRLGADPSYAIGALVPQLSRHARFVECGAKALAPSSTPNPVSGLCIFSEEGPGGGAGADTPHSQDLFVIEADESDGSLREFHPEHAIVLNLDAEHLDYYESLDAICREFHQFVSQTRRHVIFCADDIRLTELLSKRPGAVSYGFNPLAAYRIELESSGGRGQGSEVRGQRSEVRGQGSGERPLASAATDHGPRTTDHLSRFTIWHKGARLGEFSTHLLGEMNISNASAVIAFLHQTGYAPGDIARAIECFRGATRRQEALFVDDHYRVFDDYGHHPEEIRATLRAFKALRPRRLLVAFQPHRFTRTRHLLTEFATAFNQADRLWLMDVYAASEPQIPGVNGRMLAETISKQGPPVAFVPERHELRAAIRAAMQPGDLVLFLGAGADITVVAHDLAAQLQHEKPSIQEKDFSDLAARLSSESLLRSGEPLKRRTTLRVGGNADLYVEPASEADLAEVLKFCAKRELPFTMLGRGSNLLIRDHGIRGIVICLAQPNFSRVEVDGERIHCGAGAKLKAVAVQARRHELAGLEFLEGIPGSVGGAMRMNAGAMGSWMFEAVERIRFMDYAGEIHERAASEVTVEYRGCPLFKNHIAIGAVLKGQRTSPEIIRQRMDAFSRKRWDSQPNQSSAGCIFKNPPTIPAGRLIDELGLKGTRVGGAMVSDVHANFIVNDGSATAQDVLSLIEVIKQRAQSARGIVLETEVEILGED